jgi:hypothetical protein
MANQVTSMRNAHIAAITVRGQGLTAESGRTLASAMARAVVRHAGGGAAAIDQLTIRLPASAIAADGSVDQATITAALGRRRSAADA